MGHRALIAVEQDNGRYDTVYSHWGAVNLRLRAPLAEWNAEGRDGGPPESDDEPTWTNDTLEKIAGDRLDYLMHEAFYVVPNDADEPADVEAFDTIWFGRINSETEAEQVTDSDKQDGALIAPRWYDGQALSNHYKGNIRGYIDAMIEEVKGDRLTVEEAEDRTEHYVYGQANRSGVGSKTNPPYIPRYSPRARMPPGVSGRITGIDAHDGHAGRTND